VAVVGRQDPLQQSELLFVKRLHDIRIAFRKEEERVRLALAELAFLQIIFTSDQRSREFLVLNTVQRTQLMKQRWCVRLETVRMRSEKIRPLVEVGAEPPPRRFRLNGAVQRVFRTGQSEPE